MFAKISARVPFLYVLSLFSSYYVLSSFYEARANWKDLAHQEIDEKNLYAGLQSKLKLFPEAIRQDLLSEERLNAVSLDYTVQECFIGAHSFLRCIEDMLRRDMTNFPGVAIASHFATPDNSNVSDFSSFAVIEEFLPNIHFYADGSDAWVLAHVTPLKAGFTARASTLVAINIDPDAPMIRSLSHLSGTEQKMRLEDVLIGLSSAVRLRALSSDTNNSVSYLFTTGRSGIQNYLQAAHLSDLWTARDIPYEVIASLPYRTGIVHNLACWNTKPRLIFQTKGNVTTRSDVLLSLYQSSRAALTDLDRQFAVELMDIGAVTSLHGPLADRRIIAATVDHNCSRQVWTTRWTNLRSSLLEFESAVRGIAMMYEAPHDGLMSYMIAKKELVLGSEDAQGRWGISGPDDYILGMVLLSVVPPCLVVVKLAYERRWKIHLGISVLFLAGAMFHLVTRFVIRLGVPDPKAVCIQYSAFKIILAFVGATFTTLTLWTVITRLIFSIPVSFFSLLGAQNRRALYGPLQAAGLTNVSDSVAACCLVMNAGLSLGIMFQSPATAILLGIVSAILGIVVLLRRILLDRRVRARGGFPQRDSFIVATAGLGIYLIVMVLSTRRILNDLLTRPPRDLLEAMESTILRMEMFLYIPESVATALYVCLLSSDNSPTVQARNFLIFASVVSVWFLIVEEEAPKGWNETHNDDGGKKGEVLTVEEKP